MCGIAGYIALNHQRPEKSQLEELFKGIQPRGRDASGYAYLEANKLKIIKAPLLAEKLITKKHWRKLKTLPPIMIMHTRAATQGDVKDNKNNHPILYQKNAMVHNGVIYNEADFDIPNTDVDSLAILKSWVANEEDITKTFASLEGSFAVAILTPKKPNQLTLFRHSNPIELLFDTTKNILYFASTDYALKTLLEEEENYIKGFKVNNRYFKPSIPNNSYMEIIRKDGLIKQINDLEPKPRVYNYSKQYNSWNNREYYGYDFGDDYYSNNNHQLPTKQTKKDDDTRMLFLEYLAPSTKKEYEQVNAKLATSDYEALSCPHCSQPTIINKNETNPICTQCKTIISKESKNVN